MSIKKAEIHKLLLLMNFGNKMKNAKKIVKGK